LWQRKFVDQQPSSPNDHVQIPLVSSRPTQPLGLSSV
jgi:hypothetical protein